MQRSSSRRSIQMADQIMQVLATILVQEVEDPVLSMATITGVRLNRDFSIAEVLYTHLRGKQAEPDVQKAFLRAKGFLRSQLGKKLNLRAVPDLRFSWDSFLEDMVYDAPPETTD